MSDVFVSPRAQIGAGVRLGRDVRIYGPAEIADGVWLDDGVVIGYPSPETVSFLRTQRVETNDLTGFFDIGVTTRTAIGPNSFLRSGAIVYEGCVAGGNLDCAHQVIVRERCVIGEHVELGPLTYVKRECQIGDFSRIATSLGDRTVVGRHCTVYGRTVHKFLSGVSGLVEPAPIIEDGVVIGREACVVGGVTVGRLAYVGAGAVVSCPVAPETVVAGNPARFVRNRSREEAPDLWARVLGSDE